MNHSSIEAEHSHSEQPGRQDHCKQGYRFHLRTVYMCAEQDMAAILGRIQRHLYSILLPQEDYYPLREIGCNSLDKAHQF